MRSKVTLFTVVACAMIALSANAQMSGELTVGSNRHATPSPAPYAAAPRLSTSTLALHPAPTAMGWHDGVLVGVQDEECFGYPGGPFYDYIYDTYLSYYGDQTTGAEYPKVGDRYYVAVHISNVAACAGIRATMELILPANTYLAIDPQNPVICQSYLGQVNDGSCPQNLSAGTHGGYNLNPLWGGPGWPMGHSAWIEVQVPVYTTAVSNGSNPVKAHIDSADGWNNPSADPQEGIYVPANSAPGVTYPVPSATLITDTTARTTANIVNHYHAGTAYFDIGTDLTYADGTLNGAIPSSYDITNVYVDWTGANPGTLYHWRVRFYDSTSSITYTGIDQTFKTTGTAPPHVRGDVTGDGKADVAWRHATSGANYLWTMNGSSAPATAPITSVTDANWKIVGSGDFDGDGKTDLLWRNSSTGDNYLWLMNGTSVTALPLTSVADPNWKVVAVGDFNGDGRADIFWRHATSGANYIWLMNGATATPLSTTPVTDVNWKVAGTGDFNSDGKYDIVWRNTASGANYIWLMNGASISLSGAITTISDQNWSIVAVGDFDGDGNADLFWRHATSGANYLWTIGGVTVLGTFPVTNVGDLNWTVVGAGDFNGDGKADLFWRHATSGANYVWIMNGATLMIPASMPGVADANWKVASPK